MLRIRMDVSCERLFNPFMQRPFLFGVLWLTIAFAESLGAEEDTRNSDREWQVYGGDLGSTKYSSLDQINRSNVQELELVWRFRVPDMKPGKRSTMQFNPIVADGVIFVLSLIHI